MTRHSRRCWPTARAPSPALARQGGAGWCHPPAAARAARTALALHQIPGGRTAGSRVVRAPGVCLLPPARTPDGGASRHRGRGGWPAYARALEALYQYNLAPAVLGRTASHSALVDRMTRAGAPPAWPRPEPPARLLPFALLLVSLVASATAGATVWRRSDRANQLLAVAIDGTPLDVARLGLSRWQEGDVDEALNLLGAAEVLEPDRPYYATCRALILAQAGRCAEAKEALESCKAAPESSWLEPVRAAVEECAPKRLEQQEVVQ